MTPRKKTNDDDLLTSAEAAEHLGLSRIAILKARTRGRLPAAASMGSGRRITYLFRRGDLNDYAGHDEED